MKKNVSYELIVAIVLFILGFFITLLSSIFTQKEGLTILEVSGVIISAVSFMWAIFDVKISKCSEQREHCINRFQLEYISSEKIWVKVSTLLDSTIGGSELLGVVSIRNTNEFNKKIEEFAKKLNETNSNIQFKRILCFDADKRYSKATKDWFLSMIDSKYDTKNEFHELRKAISNEKIEFMYYPKELFADFLVLKSTDNPNEMVYSIITDLKKEHSYANGFYCSHQNLINDFDKQFRFIWEQSKKFFNDEVHKQEGLKHEFYSYWNPNNERIEVK